MESLGIQPAAFIAQLVIVFILYFLLKKFVFGPVTNLLNQRSKQISDSLKHAEEITQQQQDLAEKISQETKKAQQQGLKLVNEAKKNAQAEADKIIAQAREKAKEIRQKTLNEAKKEVASQQAKLKDQVAIEAAGLAKKALQKILKTTDKQLINQLQAKKFKQWQA